MIIVLKDYMVLQNKKINKIVTNKNNINFKNSRLKRIIKIKVTTLPI